jgi:hypothetical protein
MGAACGFGLDRSLRQYRLDPSRSARLNRARRAGFRLGVSWLILLLSGVIAVAVGSFAIFAVGIALAVAVPLLLRVRQR